MTNLYDDSKFEEELKERTYRDISKACNKILDRIQRKGRVPQPYHTENSKIVGQITIELDPNQVRFLVRQEETPINKPTNPFKRPVEIKELLKRIPRAVCAEIMDHTRKNRDRYYALKLSYGDPDYWDLLPSRWAWLGQLFISKKKEG